MNPQPPDRQSGTLPIELQPQNKKREAAKPYRSHRPLSPFTQHERVFPLEGTDALRDGQRSNLPVTLLDSDEPSVRACAGA